MTVITQPGPAAGPATRHPIRELLPLVSTRRRLFWWTVLAGMTYQAAMIGSSALGAYLVGQAATGAAELVPTLWALTAAVLAAAEARWWQMWVAHDFAYSLLAILRVRVFDGLARLAPRYLLGRAAGTLPGR